LSYKFVREFYFVLELCRVTYRFVGKKPQIYGLKIWNNSGIITIYENDQQDATV